MAKADDHYTRVAEKLIEKLKEGAAPWQKSFDAGGYGTPPMNPTTGKRYRGGNMIHLMLQDHRDPRWMTYRQAQEAGAQVKEGEKGTPIIYWKFGEEQVVPGEGENLVKVELERPRSFISYVFNGEQIEVFPPFLAEKPRECDVVRAEKLLKASGATIINRSQASAFYKKDLDTIYLPKKEQFPSEAMYYSTALYELGHWTGYGSRLNREFGPFGSMTYAKEELRAKISGMMLSAELGIGQSADNHAAYVRSWIKTLEDDPRELFRAATDAEKILNYVMSMSA